MSSPVTEWEAPVRVGVFSERLRLLVLCVSAAYRVGPNDIVPGRTNCADARAAFVYLAMELISGMSIRVLAKYMQLTEGAVRELRVKAGNQTGAFVWAAQLNSARYRYLDGMVWGMT